MLGRFQTLKQMFQRYRRPGNFFFASAFLAVSLTLLSQLGNQVSWLSSTKWSSQPALWPAIAVIGMTVFAVLNWISSLVSPRIEGRWEEVAVWLQSLEFVVWFMAYVVAVPRAGYLPSTIAFAFILTLRMGYRSRKMFAASVLTAIAVVVVFKSFLQVRVPGGQVYEYLPDALRSFMLTYL